MKKILEKESACLLSLIAVVGAQAQKSPQDSMDCFSRRTDEIDDRGRENRTIEPTVTETSPRARVVAALFKKQGWGQLST